MPHLAEVVNGIVTRVIVVHDRYGDLSGQEWATQRYGGTWVRTYYQARGGTSRDGSTIERKNYAGIDYTYDADRDAFIPPKPPYDSWRLVEETALWRAPVEYPRDGREYVWNEARQQWDLDPDDVRTR